MSVNVVLKSGLRAVLTLAKWLQHHAVRLPLKLSACFPRKLTHVAEKAFFEVQLRIRVVLLEKSFLVYLMADSLLVVFFNVVSEVGLRFGELNLSANFPQKLTGQVYALFVCG